MKTKKKHDVLVLNKNFTAIHIISWQKAMSLIIQETARAMDYDYVLYDLDDWLVFSELDDVYAKVLTSKHKISLPEIIVLRVFDRLPTRETKYSRQTLFQRDEFTCGYCGKVFPREKLTVDHVVPRSHGGKTHWKNTITACTPCNSKKNDRTPEQAKMKLLFQPRQPKWVSPLTKIKSQNSCKMWERFLDKTLVNLGDNIID